jgi:hypothetical protein
MDLYRKRYESTAVRLNLEMLEDTLRLNKDVLLSHQPVDDDWAYVERAAGLAMLFAWMAGEKRRRLITAGGFDSQMQLTAEALRICETMKPVAGERIDELGHCYYSMLLTEAQLQHRRKARFDLLRQVTRDASTVSDPNHRALLYGRIGEVYRDYVDGYQYFDFLRSIFWSVRAIHVPGSSNEVRDEISFNFYRCA